MSSEIKTIFNIILYAYIMYINFYFFQELTVI